MRSSNARSASPEKTSVAFLGYIYGQLGRRDEAERLLRELERPPAGGQPPPSAFAVVHAGLGDLDTALDCLERAYLLRDHLLLLLTAYPPFDPLRSHPRFAELVRRVGLPSAAAGSP